LRLGAFDFIYLRRSMARGLTPTERQSLLLQVRDIYARLAQRPIERRCTGISDCCRFRLTGRTPFLTRGEALLAYQGSRAVGKKKVPAPADGACPLLGADGRCTIYDSRPFACRTHFCEAAGGPYTRKEVRDLIHELEAIDQRLGGSGGMGLPAALVWAEKEQR
jgi:Fe-S-cluster containining protein